MGDNSIHHRLYPFWYNTQNITPNSNTKHIPPNKAKTDAVSPSLKALNTINIISGNAKVQFRCLLNQLILKLHTPY